MPALKTDYEHIVLNADGTPVIAGTSMKVTQLLLEKTAYGWSPEELRFQHPHLTLGQIYSALAYYWDHQEEVDQEIERRFEFVNSVQQTTDASPLFQRLKARAFV